MKQVHERLCGGWHLLNDRGQYLYFERVGGCLITGNEDGIMHFTLSGGEVPKRREPAIGMLRAAHATAPASTWRSRVGPDR